MVHGILTHADPEIVLECPSDIRYLDTLTHIVSGKFNTELRHPKQLRTIHGSTGHEGFSLCMYIHVA